MQDDTNTFDDSPTSVWRKGSAAPESDAPKDLMLLFAEACSMHEARWGSISAPNGAVYRNFTRVSRPGFGPRFASGNGAAPKPAAAGLEVCREADGWLLELVFDETRLTYSDLAKRLSGIVEVLHL